MPPPAGSSRRRSPIRRATRESASSPARGALTYVSRPAMHARWSAADPRRRSARSLRNRSTRASRASRGRRIPISAKCGIATSPVVADHARAVPAADHVDDVAHRVEHPRLDEQCLEGGDSRVAGIARRASDTTVCESTDGRCASRNARIFVDEPCSSGAIARARSRRPAPRRACVDARSTGTARAGAAASSGA